MGDDLVLRPPVGSDWAEIASLADVAVEHVADAPGQAEWVANRRAFRGEQMHLVGTLAGVVVGYCGLERKPGEPSGQYRIFVVTSWADTSDVAEELYRRLEDELMRRRAEVVWLREYAGDAKVLDFVQQRGFEVRERYELGGSEIITLTKELRGSDPAA